ncbi:Uncharacterised protein [Yersinia frederiksenii]|nr:Uncharacterised protein [Yersinia frederiksenii]CQH43214.1 Uncharacterised protein [Yersinia frederiksenii]
MPLVDNLPEAFLCFLKAITFLLFHRTQDTIRLSNLARLEPTPLKMVWLFVFRIFDLFK